MYHWLFQLTDCPLGEYVSLVSLFLFPPLKVVTEARNPQVRGVRLAAQHQPNAEQKKDEAAHNHAVPFRPSLSQQQIACSNTIKQCNSNDSLNNLLPEPGTNEEIGRANAYKCDVFPSFQGVSVQRLKCQPLVCLVARLNFHLPFSSKLPNQNAWSS